MAYSDYLCELDQEYRGLQDRIAGEWRVEGETDGDEGVAPEFPSNSAYMQGYNAGRARYIKRLADFEKVESGRLCRCALVCEQDCNCKTVWSDEF